MDGDVAHFYVIRRGFNLNLNYDVQMMDIGAALCHYSEATGKDSYFIGKPKMYNGLEYVLSVK